MMKDNRLKTLLRSWLFGALLLFGVASGQAQTQPCSINAGGPFDVCFNAGSFQLQGLIGSNVNPASVDWDVSNPAGFNITNENDLQSTVTPVLPGGFPFGPVTFTLDADCLDGSHLTTTVVVTIENLTTTAKILADGNNVDAITVCTSVSLSAGAIPAAGEVGTWKLGFQSNDISVAGDVHSNSIDVSIVPNNFMPCRSYTFYYEISNGGCASVDSIVVTFLASDPNIRFTNFFNNMGICSDGNIPLVGTPVGCTGTGTFEVISVPQGASIPAIENYTINNYDIQANVHVEVGGEYVFAYHVNVPGGTCPSGTDIVRIFVCLKPEYINTTFERYCGIPEHALLESPQYPNAIYVPWTWSSNPTITTDTPVITPINDWSATADIFNFDVTKYRFTQKIILDTCYYELEEVSDTFPCPGGYIIFNEVLDTILYIICEDGALQITVQNHDLIQDLHIQLICSGGKCQYVVSYTQYIAVVCYVNHIIEFFAKPEVPDSTVNLLCGGLNPFLVKNYFPPVPNASVRVTVRDVPDDHPNLDIGDSFFGYPSLNLLPPGRYEFEVVYFIVQGCRDTATLVVNVDNIPAPAAPEVSDFCVNDIVQLVGSIPANPAAQVLWTQISGPTLTFLDPITSTDPRVTSTQSGHVVLEYSFSTSDDCYLADTVEFDVIPCDTGCLTITLVEVNCFDNNSPSDADDYWNFVITISGGDPASYWVAPAVPEAGPYDVAKTIWVGNILASGSTYTLTVNDFFKPECTATITVQVPEPCSDSCTLSIETRVGECNDNRTPYLISDDFYYVDLQVNGVADNECWMVKRTNSDGSSEILGTYYGTTPVTLGPFLVTDGNWGLWVVLCDMMTCNRDAFIIAPEPCSGCHDVTVSNITCFDNNSSDPSDDYWTFDILVNGGPGTFWTATAPVNQSGPYGVVKTIHMGHINQYGSSITFSIYDNTTKACRTDMTIPVPTACSDSCNLEIRTEVTRCDDNGTPYLISDDFYSVNLDVSGIAPGECWMVKRTNPDGTSQVLGTYYGPNPVSLGPFLVSEGNWGIWVVLCDTTRYCNDDGYIIAPEPCSGCQKVTISNVTCYDNGTSDPNDDHWSFDILVDGGPGSYWTATAPVSQSGPYGVVKTIYMGAISQYGGTIEFSIFDDKNKECRTDVSIVVPRACSDECKLNVQTKFSECKRIEGETIYYVYLTVTGANGNCWTVKRKLSDGTEIMLGTWSGDQSIILGPFNASEGDWTIWVMACGQFDCVRDLYIRVPCRDGGTERSEKALAQPATTFNLFPSPVLDALNIQRQAPADSPMAGEAQFIVLDMLGKTVLQSSMPVAKDYRLLVNELSPGLYYLVVKEQGNVNWTAKFIKR